MKCRYESLNGLRTIACIFIVMMHVMANSEIKPSRNFIVTNIIANAASYVSLFMMISAFSLCCGYYSRFKNCNIKINDFYKKRYIRIFPFFFLLTIIDVLICIVSENFSLTNTVIGEMWEAFANVTLVFGLIPGNGITVIGVGWFIGVIFLFYMLFPFFIFLMDNKKRAWLSFVISIILYFSLLLYFGPIKGVGGKTAIFMSCAPFFMAGGIVYLYCESFKRMTSVSRISLYLIAGCYTAWYYVFPDFRFSLSNLVLFMLWLVYAVCDSSLNRGKTFLNNRIMSFISGISMEIYLCHMMFYRVVEKVHIERIFSDNDVVYIINCVLVLLSAGMFSYVWKKWGEAIVLNKFAGHCMKI